jgi:NAD(P)H-hydrate epimerase
LPTGLNSDTGSFDTNGLPADITLMLGLPKLGAVARAGEGVCGEIRVLDIGIPKALGADVKTEWLTEELAVSLLPERPADSHKGTFGRTLIIGGSPNYLGAALLSTNAAVRSGAGLVFLAAREPVYRLVAGRVEEAIYYSLPTGEDGEFRVREACAAALGAMKDVTSLLIGPGLGQSAGTVQFVEQLVRALPENVPAVLDADALNILARVPQWWESVKPPKVLTPHPGEMARLMARSIGEMQKDRVGTALEAAERFNATVVFKGAATVIAEPGGRLRVSPWVNSGLAKGGTGDVLAGLMAGMLAQAPERPFDMASAAVYVHGLAGELARRVLGEAGMTAGDVARKLPEAFMQLMT